ncbi:MAG: adenylate kinase [Planctomycetota bacterium]
MTGFYLLFGPPAAGKGTQAQSFSQHLGVPHVSTGDMFRAHLKGATAIGKEVEAILASGNLVPDSITNRMVAGRLAEPDATGGVLLDGFPRNVPQSAWLDGYLAAKGTTLAGVVVLEVADEELKRRLAGRAQAQGRSDDADPAVIQLRIDTYRQQSEPCLAYYEETGVTPVHRIDGMGSVDEVAARIRAVVPR